MEIVAEYVVDPVDGLLKLLFLRPFTLGFLTNARLNFRPVFRSHREAHILNELSGGIIGRQAEQLRGEPDHVAFFLTAEADKVLIDFHAWSLIRMKRTAGHPGTVDFYAIMLRDFAGADLFFYLGIDPQAGHILDDTSLDVSGSDLIDHILESRTVKAGTGDPIIGEVSEDRHAVGQSIVLKDPLLVHNGV